MAKKRLQNYKTKHDGDGFITINGNIIPAFKISKLSIETEVIKTSKRFLNERVEQSAARGLKISGDIGFYACTKDLCKAIEEFKNGGEHPEITIQGWCDINGKERTEVLATEIIFEKLPLVNIDDSSDDEIIFETSFTANDYQVIE